MCADRPFPRSNANNITDMTEHYVVERLDGTGLYRIGNVFL